MYPWFRLSGVFLRAKRLSPAHPLVMHVSQHRVSLFDCDMFGEMNNGRILTILELGRWELSLRSGLWPVLRQNGWGFAVAGASVRYRKRLTPFERFEMRTQLLGWDERFLYIEQGMFKTSGDCANHCLFRTAIVSKGRALPPADVAAKLNLDQGSPALPDWVNDWIKADKTRPWPPLST